MRRARFLGTTRQWGMSACTEKDGNKLQYCTSSLFYPQCLNGETVIPSCCCFSPGKVTLYCFVCKLFNEYRDEEGFLGNGYSEWKNAYRSISSHEISAAHKNALISLTVRKKLVALITILQNKLMRNRDTMRHWFLLETWGLLKNWVSCPLKA